MSLVDLGKRLLEAAKRGDTDEVRTLMTNGAPFTTDWLGTSPLHFAAHSGHIQTAEVLLRAGISRDARTKVDRTPLHVAAQEGHVTIVNTLLANAADIDAKDMLKMTPLHWASEKGHMDIVETLVKHGADVNVENKFDLTPLDIAISTGRTILVPLLQNTSDATLPITDTEPETVTIETSETTIATNEVAELAVDGAILSHEKNAHVIPLQVFQNQKATDGSGDQNSTQVLATLAALAEATAPNSTQSNNNAEVMNWLESQGITMISTADSNIISSAVESGHTISLTDAGKIALNIIQEETHNPEAVVAHEDETNIHTIVSEDGTENVFTIVSSDAVDDTHVTEENQILVTVNEDGEVIHSKPSLEIDTDESGMILEEGGITHLTNDEISLHESQHLLDEDTEPTTKRIKLEPEEISGEVDISSIIEKHADKGIDKDELRRQLEAVQKQAHEYKLQLQQKEQEAQDYKQQLSEIAKTQS